MPSSRKDSATFVDKAPLVLTLTPPPARTQSHNPHTDPFQLVRLGPPETRPSVSQVSNPATSVGPSNRHQINPNGACSFRTLGKIAFNFSNDFIEKVPMDVSSLDDSHLHTVLLAIINCSNLDVFNRFTAPIIHDVLAIKIHCVPH